MAWRKARYGNAARGGFTPDGMVQFTNGFQDELTGAPIGEVDNIDAILLGEQTEASKTGRGIEYYKGRQFCRTLRGILKRGALPWADKDEFGYLVAGEEQTLVDAALNDASQVLSTVTGGLVQLGDAGGIEDAFLKEVQSWGK